ncbi:putative F-box only protein [Naja naja]|nr:putative F-box only protein [Naja naja]
MASASATAAGKVQALREVGRRGAWDWNAMANSESDDDSFMAVDSEDTVAEGTMDQEDGVCAARPEEEEEEEEGARPHRSMQELPEEVLEYILSFLSPYQEHKTAALVCKQWYRLIKGVAHQCYHGFIKSVQEGNIQWESRTYPYPGTPITQRFSHSEYSLAQGAPWGRPCSYVSRRGWMGAQTAGRLQHLRRNEAPCLAGKQKVLGEAISGAASASQISRRGRSGYGVLVTTMPTSPCTSWGCTQSSCNAAFNDLWRLDLNSKEWIRPLASGSYPSPKAGATLVVYKDLLVLFGGWTRPSPYPLHQPERFFDEIHTYSPSKNWWNCVVTTHGPPPMAGHSSCVIQDRMIIVIDDETILVLGGCGGPNALFKDAWLLHMRSDRPWAWQPLKVENEDHGAPELWCHPACKVGQCVVVFSQAPSGRAPLSPSLNSRPSPISATPPALHPETRECRSQSPVWTADEAPCVNGRWGTLRPRGQRQTPCGSREGSLSPARDDSSPVLNGSEALSPGLAAAVGGASPESPLPLLSPSAASVGEGYELKAGPCFGAQAGLSPRPKGPATGSRGLELGGQAPFSGLPAGGGRQQDGLRNPPDQTNGIHTPPHVSSSLAGVVSPSALQRSLEAVQTLSSRAPPTLAARSPPRVSSPGSPGGHSNPAEAAAPARSGSAQGDGHALPAIARRLGHHPPQSLNVGKPLYQSVNCKPMQMYVLDIKEVKGRGRVQWKVFHGSSVVGPPETSLHTVVQGRGEVIIFGGLMDKKQNVKYYPKTNALYFVRAKR